MGLHEQNRLLAIGTKVLFIYKGNLWDIYLRITKTLLFALNNTDKRATLMSGQLHFLGNLALSDSYRTD